MSYSPHLSSIFANTLSPDKSSREAAERALNEFVQNFNHQYTFPVLQLLQLAYQTDGPNNTPSVSLASAIRFRNIIGKRNWHHTPTTTAPPKAVENGLFSDVYLFTPEERTRIKQELLPAVCLPQLPEAVRRQLLSAVSDIITYDCCGREGNQWMELVPFVEQQVIEKRERVGEAMTVEGAGKEPALLEALYALKGVVSILYVIGKFMNDPLSQRFEPEYVEQYVTELALPQLTSLLQLLFHLYSEVTLQEYHRDREARERVEQGILPPSAFPSFSSGDSGKEEGSVSSQLAHCLRLTTKSLFCCVEGCLPRRLCDLEFFKVFFQCTVAAPLGLFLDSWLPVTKWRLELELHLPRLGEGSQGNHLTAGDQFEEFQRNPHFRYIKHVIKMAYKFCQEFIKPKETPKSNRPVAKYFHDSYFDKVVESSLTLVRWHCHPIPLTSKGYIYALEVISLAVEHKAIYQSLLCPNAEEIMTTLLFPRLSYSKEEEELWEYNPEEYLRKQRNPSGDLYNPKIVSTSCLMSLAVPVRKFHSQDLLFSLVNFLINQFQAYSGLAVEAVKENSETHLLAHEAAHRVDAALYCLYQFKTVLQAMEFGDSHLEMVLVQYVVPMTRCPIGFVRARAVQVLAEYAHKVQWSSADRYVELLSAVMPLLEDKELPVQVQVCECLSRLICHEYARSVVTPVIANIVQKYFELMRLMNNEGVVRTLRKTIRFYEATLSEWAVQLVQLLVQHFEILLENVTREYQTLEQNEEGREGGGKLLFSEEEDQFANLLMVSDEVMDTIRAVVRSLPVSPSAYLSLSDFGRREEQAAVEAQDTFLLIQQAVQPMLFTILNHRGGSSFGFMDGALNLLTTLLARSPRVHRCLWRLIPCLHRLLQQAGTSDYIAAMMAPIENYAGVDPLHFMLVTMGELYADQPEWLTPLLDQDRMAGVEPTQWTPYHYVLSMCEVVYKENVSYGNHNITIQEVASVAKIHDAVLLSYFSRAVLPFLSPEDATSAAAPAAAVATTMDIVSRVRQLLNTVLTQVVSASTSPRLSANPTFLVLLCNNVLAACLVNTLDTIQGLQQHRPGMPTMIFQQYISLCSTEDMDASLRSYDRQLFIVAVASMLRAVAEGSSDSNNMALDETVSLVRSILTESDILWVYAQREVQEYTSKLHTLQKQVEKRRKLAEEGGEDEEEYEDMTDDEDDDDFTDDDNMYFGEGNGNADEGEEEDDDNDDNDDDDGEGEEFEDIDATTLDNIVHAAGGNAHQLQQMVKKAQKVRRTEMDEGGQDEERQWEKEEDLLEDTDFTSCLDTLNVWTLFLSSLQQHQSLPNTSDVYQCVVPHSSLFTEAQEKLQQVLEGKKQLGLIK